MDPERQMRVRPGADDNASGTAAALEIARRFSLEAPPVSVLFVHFDAEEMGLLGSREFVESPSVPLDSITLMINLDMVGRLGGSPLHVEIGASSDGFESIVTELAEEKRNTGEATVPED